MANKRVTSLGIFAVGAGVGAAVALLFAPRAGRHTRRRLVNTANRSIRRLEDVENEVRSRVSEWADEAKETIAAGREAAAEGQEQVVRALEKVRECMEDSKVRVEQYVRSVTG